MKCGRRRVLAGGVLAFAMAGTADSVGRAQESIASVSVTSRLPNAPSAALQAAAQLANAQAEAQVGVSLAPETGKGSISAAVEDPSGAAVAGAQIVLQTSTGATERQVTADGHGAFLFDNIGLGPYKLVITADGFEPYVSADITLVFDEDKDLQRVVMAVATRSTSIDVTASPDEVAHAQVKEEEKQRVLGIIPNFYTSYIWKAAPLPKKLKYELAFRATTDPVTVLIVAGIAGVQQSHNTFPGYGSGPGAYGKRFGAAYADNVIGRFVGGAILPSLFHQDPRYFYKGTGSVWSRGAYAASTAVIARGDNGKWQPNYSHVLGNFIAAGLSNVYRAPGDRQTSLTLRNGLIITGTNAIGNVVREFLLRKMTPNLPSHANGKS